jgi:phosphatidylglycerophosphatase A
MQVKMETCEARNWKDVAAEVFATVAYLGYFPFASGTVGSLPAILVGYWLSAYHGRLLILIILMFLLGIAASSRAEGLFARKDPREVVIDEFVGMLVALFWLPPTWNIMLFAFFLFRLFDILKPYPARRLEGLSGGLGVMADDIVAGFYANVCIQILLLIFGYFGS